MDIRHSRRDSSNEESHLMHTVNPESTASDENPPNVTGKADCVSEGNQTLPGVIKHGDISFSGITRETKSRFILLSEGTGAEHAWKQMEEKWDMKKPETVISVAGPLRPFYLDDKIESSLKATILKASQLPNSYIITGGAYSGIMKLVGDALQESSSGVSLGIPTWKYLRNTGSIDDDSQYVVGSWLSHKGLYLDYRHKNHIILKETEEEYTENQFTFRVSLEKYLKDQGVGSVLLLVNGGFGTLDFIHDYVIRVSCPVVIVGKSGKVADLVVYGLNNWKDIKENKGEIDEDLLKQIYLLLIKKKDGDKMKDYLAEDENKTWIHNYYKTLVETLEHHDLFTVAEVGGKTDIDTAVLDALLSNHKDKEKTISEKMMLTLLWDRADYARSNIFSTWPAVDEQVLGDLMISALVKGNLDYIQLLMDFGVNMHDVLTVDRLMYLYRSSFWEHDRRYFVDEFFASGFFPYERNQFVTALKSKPNLSLRFFRWILNVKLCVHFRDDYIELFMGMDNMSPCQPNNIDEKKEAKFADPFWELFIWSILCNMPKMAKFIWSFGRNQLGKALIGAQLFRKQATYGGRDNQTTVSLNELSDSFKQIALDLLNECTNYSDNDVDTKMIYTTTLPQVANMTCLDIAVANTHYEFVAQHSIQMLLADVWTGDMTTNKVLIYDNFNFKGIIITLVRLVCILFPSFRCSKVENEEEEEEIEWWDQPTVAEPYFSKLHSFYFTTPAVTFTLHTIAWLIFLVLYAYVIMVSNISIEKSSLEILLVLYFIGYGIGELYQIIQYDAWSWKSKFRDYASEAQNMRDVTTIIVFYVAFGMSCTESTLLYAKTLHAINCGFWALRIISVATISPTIGLYVDFTVVLLKDFVRLLGVLLIIICAHWITSTSLLYQGVQTPSTYFEMFVRSYFTIFGEFYIEAEPETNVTTRFNTPKINSYDENVAVIILAFYVFMTHILFLNIIIGAISTNAETIQRQASVKWKYKIYGLVLEYSKRASTPPPLSIIHHLFLLIRPFCSMICRCRMPFGARMPRAKSTKLRQYFDQMIKYDQNTVKRLQEIEYNCAVKISNLQSKGTEAARVGSEDVLERIETMEEKISAAVDKGTVTQLTPEEVFAKIEQMMKDQISTVKNMDERIEKMMEDQISTVKNMDERISRLCDRIDRISQTEAQET